uniref:Ankyrin repeat-containing protein n=1 Tax=Zooxanthella nutricula TaxID=1333877 RepID=A0A7S2QEZ2_9DINO
MLDACMLDPQNCGMARHMTVASSAEAANVDGFASHPRRLLFHEVKRHDAAVASPFFDGFHQPLRPASEAGSVPSEAAVPEMVLPALGIPSLPTKQGSESASPSHAETDASCLSARSAFSDGRSLCPSTAQVPSSRQSLVETWSSFPSAVARSDLSSTEPGSESSVVRHSEHRAARVFKLRCFLARAGFRSVNEPKHTRVAWVAKGFLYPLHAAVKANDVAALEALLWARADVTKTDAKQRTPLALAVKLNLGGSHAEAIGLLSQTQGVV